MVTSSRQRRRYSRSGRLINPGSYETQWAIGGGESLKLSPLRQQLFPAAFKQWTMRRLSCVPPIIRCGSDVWSGDDRLLPLGHYQDGLPLRGNVAPSAVLQINVDALRDRVGAS
jgi:hypothetical protein